MTKLVARLILAMLILPLAGALFLFLAFTVFGNSGPPTLSQIAIIWTVEYAFIGAYWILLWRGSVRWNRERIIGTLLVTLTAVLCGAVGASIILELARAPLPLAMLIGGGLVPIVWVLGTVLVWKESSQERLERLKTYGTDAVCCPVCGYNMTGLREARCPECGGQFTIDELLTAQHEREQELEQS
jgi:hypothetical protein